MLEAMTCDGLVVSRGGSDRVFKERSIPTTAARVVLASRRAQWWAKPSAFQKAVVFHHRSPPSTHLRAPDQYHRVRATQDKRGLVHGSVLPTTPPDVDSWRPLASTFPPPADAYFPARSGVPYSLPRTIRTEAQRARSESAGCDGAPVRSTIDGAGSMSS